MKILYKSQIQNPKLGFYEVGKDIFYNKVEALEAATRLKIPFESVHWNFNDDVYGKIDWTTPPEISLRSLYEARARQLREKYDYIIMNCSGGSDSNTALFSFINQGLHVDEIIVRYAKAANQGKKPDFFNLNPENEHSEYFFAVKPMLRWLQKVSPKTKITIHDHSFDAFNDKNYFDENFIYWCGDFQSPGFITRWHHNTIIENLREFDKDKKIGIIFGIDKPKLYLKDNKLHTFFLDGPMQPGLVPTFTDNTNITSELFYWTPDLPEIVVKQCHELKNWFLLPQNRPYIRILDYNRVKDPHYRTFYETVLKGVIYPDYDLGTFQCNKPGKSTLQEWDFWIKDFTHTNGYNIWVDGLKHIIQNVDPNYFDKAPELKTFDWNIKRMLSNEYFIGSFPLQPNKLIELKY